MMKTISILLALVNTLLAGLILLFNLSSPGLYEASAIWMLTKSLAAIFVIVTGVLTWRASMGNGNSNPVLVSGLFLLVLGAVTIVWTFHLAIISGDMEYYMVLYGASLMMQGVASLLGFGRNEKNMAIS